MCMWHVHVACGMWHVACGMWHADLGPDCMVHDAHGAQYRHVETQGSITQSLRKESRRASKLELTRWRRVNQYGVAAQCCPTKCRRHANRPPTNDNQIVLVL